MSKNLFHCAQQAVKYSCTRKNRFC